MAFLTGPPLLGFLSQRWGLGVVPWVVGASFLVVIAALTFGARPDANAESLAPGALADPPLDVA
jgi:hypothetical protein